MGQLDVRERRNLDRFVAAPQDTAARAAVEGDTERDHFGASNDNSSDMVPLGIRLREGLRDAIAWKGGDESAGTVVEYPTGGWMQTFTGRAVYPLDLRPEDIDIRDIAHALSLQCRYAGHVRQFYSVAEHSVHVARHCRQYGPEAGLEGLLHDATEAYLVDVPRPIKPFLKSYKLIEQRAWRAIAGRFDLAPDFYCEAVHEADNRILHDERAALMSPCEREWSLTGDPLGVTIECWSPERAEREFLALFEELYGED
ncbi:hypothetical protein [Devosia elaeis]|uniref:Phosphohydrolase n=1 Tax=Devosia elaeis TaxID=1770058 RepID=A0A178HM40_9HYPH|nr:hypothetical protein [Devosia elaeis]OAM73046.1 hypothetical protein A3840_18685 [Devosia elaeis]